MKKLDISRWEIIGRFTGKKKWEKEFSGRSGFKPVPTRGVAMICLDNRGRIVNMNKEAEALTGWKMKPAVGRDIQQVFNITDIETSKKMSIYEKGRFTDGPFTGAILLSREKEEHYIVFSLSKCGSKNNKNGTILQFRDESDWHKAMFALLLSELKYSDLIEAANSVILRWDRKGKIVFMNKTGVKFFGFKEKELLGKNVIGTIVAKKDMTGADLSALMRKIQVDPGKYKLNENENIKKNGRRVWMSWTNKPVYDMKTGEFTELLSIGNDITARKKAEDELKKHHEDLERVVERRTKKLSETIEMLEREIRERKKTEQRLTESEEKYRGLVDATSMAIVLIEGSRWTYANQALLDLFGYTREEFLASPMTEIMPDTPLGKNLIIANHMKRLAGEPLPPQYEVQLKKKNGEIMDGILSASRITIGGKPAVIAAFQNITPLKKAQEQERKHHEELMQASKMVALGTLVSGVAHEINNPNNFIMLNAPILLRTWNDVKPLLDRYYADNGDFRMGGMNYSEMRENMADLFAGIEEGSKRIKDIVSNLKDFARKDNSDLNQKTDINEVMRSSITLLSNLIKKSTNDFTVSYCKEPAFVKGNFQRLEQVVINILQNACQALAAKNKKISAEIACNGESVFVRIRDEGMGISPDLLPQITDPFFTTKRDSGGTGLGLSISDGIIKDHNGKMDFKSEPGKGTEVLITLPAMKEQ